MMAPGSLERRNRLVVLAVVAVFAFIAISQSLSKRNHVMRLNPWRSHHRRGADTGSSSRRRSKRRPNVILLLAEDLGYGDLASYGHPYAKTPNIDSLAVDGTKFLNFHSTGKTCAPARAGIMTGNHPASMMYYSGDDGFDRNNVKTVTELFHKAGYVVGHTGKWHIGNDEDMKNGVYGIDDVRKRAGGERDEWFKDTAAYDAAIDMVHDFVKDDKPFYLNVWGHVAHSPIKVKQHLVNQFKNMKVKKRDFRRHFWAKLDKSQKMNKDLDTNMAHYLGAIYSMDYHIGRLLDAIDELGIQNDTIIAFTADHGAATMGSSSTGQNMLGYCGGLRDYKHSYYEGGVRVPLLVRWPGMIPAGRVENSPISFLDWLPTACDLADVPYKKRDFEGESFADVWLGGDTRIREEHLFWNKEGGGDYAMMTRNGEYKLHFTTEERWEMYNIKDDIEENRNIIKCKKGVAQQMKKELRAWTKTLPDKYCRGKDCDKSNFNRLDKGKDADGVKCGDNEQNTGGNDDSNTGGEDNISDDLDPTLLDGTVTLPDIPVSPARVDGDPPARVNEDASEPNPAS